jgi:cold shock CspA family protein
MQVPPEITLKGITTTPSIEKAISRGLTKLERACDYIISTRLLLEQEQGRRQKGNPYSMLVSIKIPDRPEIIVKRLSKGLKIVPDGLTDNQVRMALKGEPEPKDKQVMGRTAIRKSIREEPITAFIRRTFESARKELQKTMEKQRGMVKTSVAPENSAVVERILREGGYGFLRTIDGREVYFHKNSLLHKHWGNLRVGTMARFTAEIGEQGLQASTVEPIEKPGVAELHEDLHELPTVAKQRVRKSQGRTNLKPGRQ